jgi:hypothetical protein
MNVKTILDEGENIKRKILKKSMNNKNYGILVFLQILRESF